MKLIKKTFFFFAFFTFALKSSIVNAQSLTLNYLEFYTNGILNFPKSVFQTEELSLATTKFIFGAKLLAEPFDIRYYQSSKTIKFSDFSESDFISNNLKNPQWSICFDGNKLSSNSKKIPLSFAIGTLDFSQSVSKLKNPSFFSSPSPLSSFSNFNYGLGIKLAQKTAQEKPAGFSISYRPTNFLIQAAVTQDNNYKLGAGLLLDVLDFFRTKSSVCFSTFDLFPKQDSSWKNKVPNFTPNKFWGLHFEQLFSVPLFSAKVSFGTLNNPQNFLRFYGTFESFFHYSFFSLGFGTYLCDNAFVLQPFPIFSISGDLQKTIYQLKINPQFTFILNNKATVKAGVCGLLDYSFDEFGYNQTAAQKLNLSAIISTSFSKDKFSLYYKLQNLILSQYSGNNAHLHFPLENLDFSKTKNPSHTIGLNYSHIFKNLTMHLKIQEVISQNSPEKFNHTESLSFYISPQKFPISQGMFSASFEHKNNTVTPKFTLGTTLSLTLKKLKFTGKIQVCSTLVVE